MSNSRIRDIPSYKKLLEDAQTFEQIKQLLPLFKPLLHNLGLNVAELENALADVESLATDVHSLVTRPDKFNAFFASRGWIMYDTLNNEVIETALTKAEAGDIDGGEQILVDYYNAKTVERHLSLMIGVKVFKPRMELARKALADYAEERYHACVPVVLSLLDGMVNDLGPHGFFAQGVNLVAWDSIAAHSQGLAQLSKVLGQTRTKTTTEPITIPYRHGILHGHDINYDNKMVAAKAWAALFSARDWALKVQKGEITAPPEPPKLTLEESIQALVQTVQAHNREKLDFEARMKAWSPRLIKLGKNIPVSGTPEMYDNGSPEQQLAQFFLCWKKQNYGHMAHCLMFSDKKYYGNKLPLRLRERFSSKTLQSFEFIDIQDDAPAVTMIKTKFVYSEEGNEATTIKDYQMIYEDAAGNPMIRGKSGGSWTLYNAYP